MTLDRGPVPLYYQIREALRNAIMRGEYMAGDQLPTEVELCEHFDVSLTTVRRALSDLTNEGLLERISGKGTFVREPDTAWDLGPFTSFTQEMKRRDLAPDNRIVRAEIVEPSERIIDALRLGGSAEPVFCLERVRLVGDTPLMIETAYLPMSRFPGIESIDWKKEKSLLRVMLDRYYVPLVEVRDVIEPTLVGERQAELLDVKPFSLALHLRTSLYMLNEELFQYSDGIIPGQRSRYLVHMKSHKTSGEDSSTSAGRSFIITADAEEAEG
jgi:GntR family transcriptional regulator